MSLCKNLRASSLSAVIAQNEYNFTCQYPNSIVLPKSVSLSRAVIPYTLLTFRDTQLSLFLNMKGVSAFNTR